jgi:integrase
VPKLTDLSISKLKPTAKHVDIWDSTLPSFGIRISPKGTKTFILKRKGREKLGRYPHTTLAEARAEATRRKYTPEKPQSLSFREARARFIDQHLSNLKPTTCYEQTNLINRFPFDRPLSAITLDDINHFLGQFSHGGARPLFNIFRTFINWTIDNNYLDRSPLKASPYKPRSRERLLEYMELRSIWHHSIEHGDFGRLIRCLILSGQRSAQFSYFDTAWVRGDVIVFPPTIMKSNLEHVTPLSPLLKQHLPSAQFNSHSSAMSRFRSGIDVAHFTLHDFRRFFSSTMASLKVPIDVTEAILDHRSGSRSQIRRIYDRHDRLPEMREALLKYEAHILTIVQP